jgi:hypothetical protein
MGVELRGCWTEVLCGAAWLNICCCVLALLLQQLSGTAHV